MELIQKRIQRGGVVTIPATLMAQTGLAEGDAVNLRVENTQIIIEPINTHILRAVLHREIERLPAAVIADLLDFAQFTGTKQPDEEAFLWQNVEAAQAYDQLHPDEIVTVTGEEWE